MHGLQKLVGPINTLVIRQETCISSVSVNMQDEKVHGSTPLQLQARLELILLL